jgi:hypothetical protein
MFVIEDEIHCDRHGRFARFDKALAELKRRAALPFDQPNHWECWLRDPDGYTVVLASPDGSADGNWRP